MKLQYDQNTCKEPNYCTTELQRNDSSMNKKSIPSLAHKVFATSFS